MEIPKRQMKKKGNVNSTLLFDKIREKLKLTKKELPDAVIKKITKLNNKLIGEWVLEHADGFQIRNNGRIIISKYLPKCLRGEKLDKIEEIMNNPKNDDYMKEMFKKRYEKSLEQNKSFVKGKKYHVNIHSFFYLYRFIWFNSRNTAFKKAELYELKPTEHIRRTIAKKILEGKDYYEWQFSDFRLKKNKILEEKRAKKDKKLKDKQCKENLL